MNDSSNIKKNLPLKKNKINNNQTAKIRFKKSFFLTKHFFVPYTIDNIQITVELINFLKFICKVNPTTMSVLKGQLSFKKYYIE
jgi:hypothetical protein